MFASRSKNKKMTDKKLLLLFSVLLVFQVGFSQKMSWALFPKFEENNFGYFPYVDKKYMLFNAGKKARGVMDTSGHVVIEPIFQDVNLNHKTGVWYGWRPDGKVFKMNAYGKIRKDTTGSVNCYHGTNLCFLIKDKLYGLIDTGWNVVKPPIYKDLTRVEQGLYRGKLPTGEVEVLRFKETSGYTPEQELKRRSRYLKDRLFFHRKSNHRCCQFVGFTDLKGDTLLYADRYWQADGCDYNPDILTVKDPLNEKEGAVNNMGELVIPCQFEKMGRPLFRKYIAAWNEDKRCGLLDFKGDTIFPFVYDAIYKFKKYPYFIFMKDGKSRLLDSLFNPILEGEFDSFRMPPLKGATVIKNEGLVGFYSFNTKVFTPCQFKERQYGPGPLFGVGRKGHYGLFNPHTGQLLTDTIYSKINVYPGNFAMAQFNISDTVRNQDTITRIRQIRKFVLLDSLGNTVFGPVSTGFNYLNGNIFSHYSAGKGMYIFDAGKMKGRTFLGENQRAIKEAFSMTSDITRLDKNKYCFTEDVLDDDLKTYEFLEKEEDENLRIFKADGKYGLLHGKKKAIDLMFDEIGYINNGYVKVKYEGKWGVLKNPFHED